MWIGLKKQETDEELVLSEVAAKKNATEENADTVEDTKDNNLNTTRNTPSSQKNSTQQELKVTTIPTGEMLLFGVGGIRIKKKDKTNTITSSKMESQTEEE